tara:strand:- start:124 stop:429 length:306 start_codon:yes stop_codon:yes gene_type:complete
LKIDPINSIVSYKELELNNFEEHSFSEIESGLRSDGKGYSWKLIDDQTFKETIDQEEYDFGQIKFSISQIEKNGRFFISITERFFHSELVCSDLKVFKIML